jgi:hypothetical protein
MRPTATLSASVFASILVVVASSDTAGAAPDQCPISIDGDAVAARVRDELLGFAGPGGEHCMPLTVACTQEQEQVVVDFTDEFGRHVERRFDSPAGAAAFLISWSRRPVLAEFAAPQRPATAARWQPAAGFALVNPPRYQSRPESLFRRCASSLLERWARECLRRSASLWVGSQPNKIPATRRGHGWLRHDVRPLIARLFR